jgi:hypothetical protein
MCPVGGWTTLAGMAVTYATLKVEPSESALEAPALSDALDALVGDLEAYSQALSGDGLEYECVEGDAPQDEFDEEDRTDYRSIKLAAVFFVVQMILLVDMVFVVFFEPVGTNDPVGSVITALLGAALFGNFGAAIAAAWAVEADRGWQEAPPTQTIGMDSDD